MRRTELWGAKFCDACGTILSQGCPGCGASNRAGARFCNACGAALDEAAGGVKVSGPAQPAAAAASAAIAAPIIGVSVSAESDDVSEGERKLVTALFADIKGSTELMEDLDPEDARAMIDPALKIMIEAVNRYDGYVVQSTGDGIFALFGAPVAHEDHPQRALYAAIRMQEEMRLRRTATRGGPRPTPDRIGVNTGEVVVRSMQTGAGQVEYTPIGHTANLASRMQTLADPGSVRDQRDDPSVVSRATSLSRRWGRCASRDVSEPVNVYEVTGLGPLRTRLQRSAGRGLTKFVGREREMDAMRRALERSKRGAGRSSPRWRGGARQVAVVS